MERVELVTGYSIPRIIKGSWQLAGGHGAVDETVALKDMLAYVEAGITAFDCADIYTGVESLIGRFLSTHRDRIRAGDLPAVQVHTKCVPDRDALPSLREGDIAAIVDRSLQRLGAERLDVVQFHWWDYEVPGCVDAARWLDKLRRAGKIRHLGVTNFDTSHLGELLDAGIPVVANQVQYSALDQRPEHGMIEFCRRHGIALLCYGTVAGGLLSDRYLGAAPMCNPKETSSLTKYALIVEEYGGWNRYQELLRALASIGRKHDVSIAMVASRYVLQRETVAGIILGVRSDRHLAETRRLFEFVLDQEDVDRIHALATAAAGPNGPVYGLERVAGGRHSVIMKANLNREFA